MRRADQSLQIVMPAAETMSRFNFSRMTVPHDEKIDMRYSYQPRLAPLIMKQVRNCDIRRT